MARRRQGEESTLTLVVAVLANLAIAAVKVIAAAVTGSAALLSESIHSVVDAGDGALLLLGVRRSRRPAGDRHPFGHGKEVYFWSFVVATVIFGAGACISIFEGIEHVLHPMPIHRFAVSYLVLGAAAVFESISFAFALRTFRNYRRTVPDAASALETMQKGKDPPAFAVLLEDAAALAGIAIAAAGVTLAHVLARPWIDGAASILIGLVLAAVAFVLGYESYGLLLGESASASLVDRIRGAAATSPDVAEVRRVRTMQLAPHEVLVALDVSFRPGADAAGAWRRLARAIRALSPSVSDVLLDATV